MASKQASKPVSQAKVSKERKKDREASGLSCQRSNIINDVHLLKLSFTIPGWLLARLFTSQLTILACQVVNQGHDLRHSLLPMIYNHLTRFFVKATNSTDL